ncbi:protoporphyrinogen oxidase HemJ [Limoniibacter endophyticus]|uniref:Protoporphyrinogen IX oxidase n=1 Tax=Limoniibacter endophyticus TaxID=1565040 RepID=A0A8J3GIW1_9HYPH|nr:protoporphyrinogen oxidase HemJ [Limoniibacter endophyticus]GHC74387.1 membrane protein [Limoniibacter endophyticus]
MSKRILQPVAVLLFVAFLFSLPAGLYLYVKSGHIVAVIAWMAGMLYLPRLFVYHSAIAEGSEASGLFKTMERRLLKAIIDPAMMAAWGFGLWLAWHGFAFQGGWLHLKITLVLLLSALHGYLAGAVARFGRDENTRSQRYWRIVNEIPTLLMILIVVLVVVKPF